MRVDVFPGSVLDAGAEALVNAANTELRHGGGVAAAIARAAGEAFIRESAAVGFCPLGQAVATGAGRLSARCVIHVPTVDYTAPARRGATSGELRAGVEAALKLAVERRCASLAFPILGAGVAGVPAAAACRAMAAGFTRAASQGTAPARVIVCAFSAADRSAAASVWGEPSD